MMRTPSSDDSQSVYDVRQDNLRALARLATSKAKFSAATGLSTASVAVYLKLTAAPRIGARFARDAESKLGLPAGCMEVPGGVQPHLESVRKRFGFDHGPHVARLANLRALVGIAGDVGTLAAATGIEQERLDFLMNRNAAPYMPQLDAAEIETSLGLPVGSLDVLGSAERHKNSLSVVFAFRRSAAPVADLEKNRIENLRALVDSVGRREFCAATGASMHTIHGVLRVGNASNPTPTQGNIYRFIEERLGLPHRSMDSVEWRSTLFETAKSGLQVLLANSPDHARAVNLRRVRDEFDAQRLSARGVSSADMTDAAALSPVPEAYCRDVESKLGFPERILDSIQGLEDFVADMRTLVQFHAGRHPSQFRDRFVDHYNEQRSAELRAAGTRRRLNWARMGDVYAGFARRHSETESREERTARIAFIRQLVDVAGGIEPFALATNISPATLSQVCADEWGNLVGPIGRSIEKALDMTFDDIDDVAGLQATLAAVTSKVRELASSSATAKARETRDSAAPRPRLS